MAYTPTTWKDRAVEKPRTYTMQENGDGTVTLIPTPGTVYEGGTPVNAGNLNHIEQGIAAALPKAGGTMTGGLNANGGISLPNNVGIVSKGTGGDGLALLYVGGDNVTALGDPAVTTRIRGSGPLKYWSGGVDADVITSAGGQTIGGPLSVNGNITIPNNVGLMGGNALGGSRIILHIASDDTLRLGASDDIVKTYNGHNLWHTGMLRINNGVLEVLIGGEWIPVGGGGPLSELRRLGSSGTAVPQNAWTTLIDLNMRGRIEYLNFVSGSANNEDPSSHYTATYRITMDGKVVSTPAQFVTDHPGLIFTYLSNGAASTTVHVPAPIYFNQRFLLEVHFSKSGYNTTYALDYRQAY
jgi:hypothetical protein